MKRRLVTVPTSLYLSKYDLEGSEDDVIARIRDLFAKARTQYDGDTVLYLDWAPHELGDGEDLSLYAKRPETDDERFNRLRLKSIHDARREALERKHYEMLRVKFEGK